MSSQVLGQTALSSAVAADTSSITEIDNDTMDEMPSLESAVISTPATAANVIPTQTGINLHALLGFSPSSPRLLKQLSRIAHDANLTSVPEPAIKAFSDSTYYSYHSLGISLIFQPIEGQLRLSSIDVYNHEARSNDPAAPSKATATTTTARKVAFGSFPSYPIDISYSSTNTLSLTTSTIGRDLTNALGEADRKGGGEGSMGIWTEWTSIGIMTEFSSVGLKAWDEGGTAMWKVLTIFEPGNVAGKEDDEEVVF